MIAALQNFHLVGDRAVAPDGQLAAGLREPHLGPAIRMRADVEAVAARKPSEVDARLVLRVAPVPEPVQPRHQRRSLRSCCILRPAAYSAVAVTSSLSRIAAGSPMAATSAMPRPTGSFVLAEMKSRPGLATKRAIACPRFLAEGELPRMAGTATAAAMPYSRRKSSGVRFCFFAASAMARSNRPLFSIVRSRVLAVAPTSATRATALSELKTSLLTLPSTPRRVALPISVPLSDTSRRTSSLPGSFQLAAVRSDRSRAL